MAVVLERSDWLGLSSALSQIYLVGVFEGSKGRRATKAAVSPPEKRWYRDQLARKQG